MYIAILGRQPTLGVAELERLYGPESVRWFSDISVTISTPKFDLDILGGTKKAGRVVAELSGDWRRVSIEIVRTYLDAWSRHEGKITLGISAYGFKSTARDIQKTGLALKSKLKEKGVSLRLIPNAEMALNTATSHHNKLGLSNNHVELLVVRSASGKVIVAESIGAQNITAYARRDRDRPRRDAFVGMLPPKLAQLMVNLAIGESRFDGDTQNKHILDPFCGTGTVLQEALLRGYSVHGTDLSQKMIDYTIENLSWLQKTHKNIGTILSIRQGDATNFQWVEANFLSAVICETYLGQPFSAPPRPEKLQEVIKNCNHIISEFLKNLALQLKSGTSLCIAVPAWHDRHHRFTHLPLINQLENFGYTQVTLKNIRNEQLLYYRENQVVARELLILKKA